MKKKEYKKSKARQTNSKGNIMTRKYIKLRRDIKEYLQNNIEYSIMYNYKIFIVISIILLLFLNNLSNAQLVNDFKVNTDTNISNPKYKAKVSSNNGITVVVWEYLRINKSNSISQIFNDKFQYVGNNFWIDTLPNQSVSPDVAVRKDGSFGVIRRSNTIQSPYDFKLYLRIYNKQGEPISNDILVNDTNKKPELFLRISCDTNNKFIVVWQSPTVFPSKPDIFFQILDSAGNRIGGNTKVNEGNNSYGKPAIAVRKDGSFIITWEDIRVRPPGDIFCQMYFANGAPMGVNQRVNDFELDTNDYQSNPDITVDSSGNFVIAFNEIPYSTGVNKIKYQRFDKYGNKIGNNISLYGNFFEVLLNSDETGNLIFLLNLSNAVYGYIYNLRIDKNDNQIGNYFLASNQFPTTPKGGTDILIINRNYINIWVDLRESNQPQIYANVRSYINPDSIVFVNNGGINIPEMYILEQNYPNPFNQCTMFNVQCSMAGNVKVKIYDITGREVAVVLNEYKTAGIFTVKIDASNLSSGVYFYTLFVDDFLIQTRKMVYVR
jgi:hypothetical protein